VSHAVVLEGCCPASRDTPLDLVLEPGELVLVTGYSDDRGERLLPVLAGLRRPAAGAARVAPSASGPLLVPPASFLDPSRSQALQLASAASALGADGAMPRLEALLDAHRAGWMLSARHDRLPSWAGRYLCLALAGLGGAGFVAAAEPFDGMPERWYASSASMLRAACAGGSAVLVLSRDPRCREHAGRVEWWP
jgi:hypothetical protein